MTKQTAYLWRAEDPEFEDQWDEAIEADAERREVLAEVEGLRAVVETGNWGGFPSPNVEAAKFAEAFGTYHGAKFGNCTASGTTALEVALKAAGVEAGDEVIMPALTFVATAAAALYMGAVLSNHDYSFVID